MIDDRENGLSLVIDLKLFKLEIDFKLVGNVLKAA